MKINIDIFLFYIEVLKIRILAENINTKGLEFLADWHLEDYLFIIDREKRVESDYGHQCLSIDIEVVPCGFYCY